VTYKRGFKIVRSLPANTSVDDPRVSMRMYADGGKILVYQRNKVTRAPFKHQPMMVFDSLSLAKHHRDSLTYEVELWSCEYLPTTFSSAWKRWWGSLLDHLFVPPYGTKAALEVILRERIDE